MFIGIFYYYNQKTSPIVHAFHPRKLDMEQQTIVFLIDNFKKKHHTLIPLLIKPCVSLCPSSRSLSFAYFIHVKLLHQNSNSSCLGPISKGISCCQPGFPRSAGTLPIQLLRSTSSSSSTKIGEKFSTLQLGNGNLLQLGLKIKDL